MRSELEPRHPINIFGVVRWSDGTVAIEDSVAGAPALSGAQLADRYWEAMHRLTFGLTRRRGNSVVAGPFELLHFGEPVVGAHSVEWPIAGGLLAGAVGGRWRVRISGGAAIASIEEFRPSLPRPVYALTHLQVHLLFTRLFLLRLRDGASTPGVPATPQSRIRAATVDVALCLVLNRIVTRRFRPGAALALLAGYHIACWSTSGRTLGGVMMGQRVVSADGQPLVGAQAALRFVTAPLSWIARRPVHDQIAGTEVVVEQKEGAALAAPSRKSV